MDNRIMGLFEENFDLSGEFPAVVESKKYAQITYGYKSDEIEKIV